MGRVHFFLPGVFKNNPLPAVNGSLWTIPFELECYLLVAALWLTKILRNRHALMAAVLVWTLAVPLWDWRHGGLAEIAFHVPGRALVTSFAFGSLLYFYRTRIPYSRWIFLLALAVAIALIYGRLSCYFVGLPAAYVVVYLGLKNPPAVPLLLSGDYSYGLYVYAVPVQQMVVASVPSLTTWWFNLPVSLCLAGLCAVFSWHSIEEPILGSRKFLIRAFDRVLGFKS